MEQIVQEVKVSSKGFSKWEILPIHKTYELSGVIHQGCAQRP